MPDILSKVIIIGPAFPLRGGIADFNEALCSAMIEKGVDTKIISFSLQYPSFLFPGKTQYDKQGNPPKGISVESIINSINPFNWFRVAKKVIAAKPDAVIIRYWLPFMGPCLGTIANRIKKNSSIKIIAITDNVIPHEKRPGDNLFTSYFVRHCDGFITMSQSVLLDLKHFTSNPNKVFLPHPIYDTFGEKLEKQTAKKKLGLVEDEKYILFFGFIRKYKGLDLLITAMADERLRKMNVKLLVAGEFYEEEEPYIELIQKYKLEDVIILRNEFIPKQDVASYFCAADLIVQPYRMATQSGITQIAYHFEKPMLVTDVGGLPEIVPNGKVGYVVATNPTSIADAITDFYYNKREEFFSRNIVIEKKRFFWDSFVEGIQQLFLAIKNS